MVMVKPAMPALDLVAAARAATTVPVAAYQVSGEYAAIVAAGDRGWLDRRAAALRVARRHRAGRRGHHRHLLRRRGGGLAARGGPLSDEHVVHAWLLRLDPAWRRRSAEERRADLDALLRCRRADRSAPHSTCYSTIGLRTDGDLLLWRMADALEPI